MIQSDNHVHTSFSSDSEAAPENMIQSAIDRGFPSICITDHMDYDFPVTEPGMDYQFDPVSYLDTLNNLQQQFPQILIRCGVELGLKPSALERCRNLTSRYPLDFVIGSTHLVDDTDPYYSSFWEGYTEKEAILRYYETTLENIRCGFDFDVYGHIDYILRYTPAMKRLRAEGRTDETYLNRCLNHSMEIIEEILRLLIEGGHGIELNTGGLKYRMGHPNPHEKILIRYRELGGELLTVGSDAHEPAYLGYEFNRIPALLKSCGFRYFTEYKDRRPIMYSLD